MFASLRVRWAVQVRLANSKQSHQKDINIMSAARCRLTESSEVVKNRWKKRKKTKKFN